MVEKWRVRSRGSCTTPRLHNLVEDFTATNLSTACFPLPEKPKSCWAREHISPVKIDRRSWTSPERSYNITRPYYICTTCDNGKYNVFRDTATAGPRVGRTEKVEKPRRSSLNTGFGSALQELVITSLTRMECLMKTRRRLTSSSSKFRRKHVSLKSA